VSDYRTVGDCLDAGVLWDQFAEDPWGGEPMFTSAADAEAHRNDVIVEWPEDEYR
jgi:hypothetical protein